MRGGLIWRKCIFEDVHVTQSSGNETGACLVFLSGFRGGECAKQGTGSYGLQWAGGRVALALCILFTTRARPRPRVPPGLH